MNHYLTGKLFKKAGQPEIAISHFEDCIESCHTELRKIYHDLGTHNYHRIGDRPEALKWYQKAADIKCLPSLYQVGIMTLKGRGTTEDVDKGRSMIKDAADQGDIESQVILADFYQKGRCGLKQDIKQSMKYLKMAIKQEYSDKILVYYLSSGQHRGIYDGVWYDAKEKITQINEMMNNYMTGCFFDKIHLTDQAMFYFAKAADPEHFGLGGHQESLEMIKIYNSCHIQDLYKKYGNK